MSINHGEIERIQNLSSCERIAGYLFYSAKLAMLGARLRKDDDSDKWNKEDDEEWQSICDELESWWYALSEEEHVALEEIEVFMAKLTCAESVLEDDNIRGYKVNRVSRIRK